MQKIRFSRIFALMIAVFILFGLFSCSSNNNGGNANNTPSDSNTGGGAADSSAETTTAAVDATSVLASLPDADYGGYEFKFWTSNRPNSTLEIRQAPETEQNGEPINDALYTRDRLIEDKYNIKITYTIIDDVTQMTNKAKKSVMAGDNSFDIVIGDFQNVTCALAQTGAIYDFNTVPNVDLSKPWWSKYATRDLTIDGKFYFPTGDITPRFTLSPYLLMFNKQLFQDYGLEYPYQQVLDGKWTIDALSQIIKDKGKDVNGDGKFDMNDFYGLMCEGMTAFSMYRGCGENMIAIKDGNPYIEIGSEKSLNVIDKLSQLLSTNDAHVDPTYTSYTEGPPFKDGRVLILGQTTGNLALFRDLNYDYGILPMPKFDENQDSYYSYCNPWGAVAVAIPKTNEDVGRTGMIVEALAAVGKYTSTPAEYDVTLKTKFTRDDYSAQMLDIICENASYDFGPIYDWGGNYTKLLDSMYKNQPFTSVLDATKDKMQSGLDKTIAVFSSNSGS
ncbi:MAG: extracellular solute-binding protein [Oscillospiraceae bacterium]|nr:extracellular solute-binding protein [Oscillospiraceae bacterium]